MTNENEEVLVRITYQGVSCINKVYIKTLPICWDNAPTGTHIKILCFKNEEYKWVKVESCEILSTISKYQPWKDNEFDLEIIGKKDMTPRVAVLPEGIFNINKITFESLVLGLMFNNTYRSYFVTWISANGKESKYTLRSYLSNCKKLKQYNLNILSPNNTKFETASLLDGFNYIIEEMLEQNDYYVTCFYIYHLLLLNWVCAPILLCYSFDFILKNEYVPFVLNPLIYLKYGHSNNIKSKTIKNELPVLEFNMKNLNFKKFKRQRLIQNVNIKLVDESWTILSMINNIPIRWENE